jgi:hypothetical protein
MVVGSALMAVLLITGWSLPEPPPTFPDRTEISRVTIRIRSDRRWPEKIVLDTSQPTLPTPSVDVAPTELLVAHLPGRVAAQMRVDFLAKPSPDARPTDAHPRPWRANRNHARGLLSTRVARVRHRRELPRWAQARGIVTSSGRLGHKYQKLRREGRASRLTEKLAFPRDKLTGVRLRVRPHGPKNETAVSL